MRGFAEIGEQLSPHARAVQLAGLGQTIDGDGTLSAGTRTGEEYSVPAANPRVWGSLLEVKGGRLIAVDQNGRPALIADTVGTGRTLSSAYPIERIWRTPPQRSRNRKTHRIHAAFRDWAGVKPAFRSDQPSVEVTSLPGDDRGYATVVNYSGEPYKLTISTSLPVESVSLVGLENTRSIRIGGSDWGDEHESIRGSDRGVK